MRSGFSLLEILVVVVLLGIIAAISIPMVAGYGTQADETAFHSDLALLRTSIEMFAADHNGAYPGSIGDGVHAAGSESAIAEHLTKFSNADGVTSDTKSSSHPFGPYVTNAVPGITVGPLQGENGVAMTSSTSNLTADASPSKAWKYSTATGQIIANTQQTASDGSKQYDEF